MMATLYEYTVVHHPRVMKDAQGNETQGPDTVVVDVERVMAKNEGEVAIRAARRIPEQYTEKLDEVEILVRPFA